MLTNLLDEKRDCVTGCFAPGGSFDATKQPLRSDFQFHPRGALVSIRWSKTIQFRERVVQLHWSYIPNSPLCPVTVATWAIHAFHWS